MQMMLNVTSPSFLFNPILEFNELGLNEKEGQIMLSTICILPAQLLPKYKLEVLLLLFFVQGEFSRIQSV